MFTCEAQPLGRLYALCETGHLRDKRHRKKLGHLRIPWTAQGTVLCPPLALTFSLRLSSPSSVWGTQDLSVFWESLTGLPRPQGQLAGPFPLLLRLEPDAYS